jgi:Na+-driven multidrug efflux pump
MQPRYWHIVLCAAVGVAAFGITDLFYLSKFGDLPRLKEIWIIALMVPLLGGAGVTVGAGGAPVWKRIVGAVVCGIMIGVFSTVVSASFAANNPVGISETFMTGIWRAFIFTLLSVLGLLITEIGLPETNRI